MSANTTHRINKIKDDKHARFITNEKFLDCLGKHWYSLLRRTLLQEVGNTLTENEVEVQNERKIKKEAQRKKKLN
jgi:hypothetical protein